MPEIFGAALMGGGSGQAFAAIGVIYPAGATCTCSYGGKTITAKDTSGRALFLVPSAGQWLVKASNGGQEVEDTVSITTQGQVASVTLAFFSATIVCTFPVDCTAVTCKKDAVTLSVPSGELSKGAYTFLIPESGEWTLECTNGVDTDTETVNVTEEKAYTVELSFRTYYFKNGDVSELTGGWTKGATGDELSLRINVRSDGYSQSDATKTNNTIDFSKINTVHVVGSLTASGEYSNANFSVGSAKVSVNGGINTSNTKKDFSVDVSNVSSGQITINLMSGRDYASCAITEIYGV